MKKGDPKHPFFAKQVKIVRANGGIVDPEEHRGLHRGRRLSGAAPGVDGDEACGNRRSHHQSGLRGRGGAGFPTGLKWGTVAKSNRRKNTWCATATKVIPARLWIGACWKAIRISSLEGMAIAAYAVGADQGFLYVRAEYPLCDFAVADRDQAAKQLGLLGGGILKLLCLQRGYPDRRGRICLRRGNRVDGIGRGQTRYAASTTAFSGGERAVGCPTLLNNVETFANIAPIISKGRSGMRASVPRRKAKGTKVFALTGKITNNGLIEVPMGIPLRQIVEEMGGGAGRPFGQICADRRAFRVVVFRRSISTRRWILNHSASSGPSWARVAWS